MLHLKGKKTEWYSDPFYSYPQQRIYLCIDAAGYGEGKGTHLSVSLCLRKGPHDDELTWPLRGKFMIKLLNQISDSEHHSVIVTYDNIVPDKCANRVSYMYRAEGWGEPKFISNTNLNKITPTCRFLKGDCLFSKWTSHCNTPSSYAYTHVRTYI